MTKMPLCILAEVTSVLSERISLSLSFSISKQRKWISLSPVTDERLLHYPLKRHN